MRPSGSPKTAAASSNETLCLARFAAAFCRSHSNSNANFHYTCATEDRVEERIGRFGRGRFRQSRFDARPPLRYQRPRRHVRGRAECGQRMERGVRNGGTLSVYMPLDPPCARFMMSSASVCGSSTLTIVRRLASPAVSIERSPTFHKRCTRRWSTRTSCTLAS